MPLAPVVALSHGGGPMPLLGDPKHKDIIHSLKHRIPQVLNLIPNNNPNRPRAIILITAHWTTPSPTISSVQSPSLLYDYYNFPPEAYQLSYPAPGHLPLAAQVKSLMEAEGLTNVKLDTQRGFDHGVFVPMLLVNPVADIPIVQISVLESEDPEEHLRMGRALRSLRQDNVAIIGSGFASFHNLPLMMGLSGRMPAQFPPTKKEVVLQAAEKFGAGLQRELEKVGAGGGRWEGVKGWRGIEGADMMHPPGRGEHFMPLIVCTGASEDEEVTRKYVDEYVGVDIVTYYWGSDEVA